MTPPLPSFQKSGSTPDCVHNKLYNQCFDISLMALFAHWPCYQYLNFTHMSCMSCKRFEIIYRCRLLTCYSTAHSKSPSYLNFMRNSINQCTDIQTLLGLTLPLVFLLNHSILCLYLHYQLLIMAMGSITIICLLVVQN